MVFAIGTAHVCGCAKDQDRLVFSCAFANAVHGLACRALLLDCSKQAGTCVLYSCSLVLSASPLSVKRCFIPLQSKSLPLAVDSAFLSEIYVHFMLPREREKERCNYTCLI